MQRNNLQKWREARGLTREELRDRAKISLGSISRIESGKQVPRGELLDRILAFFKMKVADFFSESSNVSPAEMGAIRIPLIDYTQAVLFTAEKAPNFLDDKDQQYIFTEGECSAMAYALEIIGKSMLPEFKEGDRIIVEPGTNPGPGEYVVAKEKGGEVIFRKYRAVGFNQSGKEIFELVPLNDDYATVRSDTSNVEVIGIMWEHRKRGNR